MVSDLKTFTDTGCKIAAFFGGGGIFALLSGIFVVLVFLTTYNCLFAPTSQSPMCNLFRLSESLGGKMERSGLRFENFAHKRCKIAVAKKVFFPFFFHLFTLLKRLFCPHFPKSNVRGEK